jgi:3-oxoadipate enol-lactonase
MATLKRPNCDLFYEETGEGPAIIFAHGAGGNHLSWWQQVPVFASSYHCVAFDHRGWGRSIPAGGPGPAAFVDDLIGLMDELRIDQAALVAQSMGGLACLGAAVQAPERIAALVMGGTVGGLITDAIRPLYEASRARMRSEGLASLAYDPGLRARDPALAFLYDEIMALNPPRDPGLIGAMADLAPNPDAVARLAMPILWVAGGNDPINPPGIMRAAHAHVPGSEYLEIPATGHSVYFERADEFNRQLSRFLVDAGWGSGIQAAA